MADKTLHIEQLDIGYNHSLVKNISCSLSVGDFCVLLGANGKGKSTLINTIRGSLKAISGTVLIDTKNSDEYSERELAKKIAIVSTNKIFAPELTVSDIISYGRIPYLGIFSRLSRQDLLIINKYVELLNIGELKNNYFNQLSDGQKQRVMICRALVQNTPIILLDEPTAHLDIENRVKIFELLKQISLEESKTIVCSTHELENGLTYSNKVWIIDKNGTFISEATSNLDKDSVLKALFS